MWSRQELHSSPGRAGLKPAQEAEFPGSASLTEAQGEGADRAGKSAQDFGVGTSVADRPR